MTRHPGSAKAAHGFSLLELLMTIAIILVLVGLLFPAIATAQKKL